MDKDHRFEMMLNDGKQEKEVKTMSEWLTRVLDESRAEGEEKSTLENIRNLMETTSWSAQKAMDMLKIPASLQAEYASKL